MRSRQSEDPYGGVDDGPSYGSPPNGGGIGNLAGGRRKPSQDIPMGNERRKPSRDISSPPNSYQRSNGRGQHSIDEGRGPRSRSRDRDGGSEAAGAAASATQDEIVPIKSTMAEEEVVMPPFARRDSDNADFDERRSSEQRRAGNNNRELYDDDDDDGLSPRTPNAMGLGGLSALSTRMNNEPQERPSDEYYNRRRPSEDQGPRRGGNGDAEQAAREADMRNRIADLERQVEDAEADRAAALAKSNESMRQLEAELVALQQVCCYTVLLHYSTNVLSSVLRSKGILSEP
jgi:hypothetical protein